MKFVVLFSLLLTITAPPAAFAAHRDDELWHALLTLRQHDQAERALTSLHNVTIGAAAFTFGATAPLIPAYVLTRRHWPAGTARQMRVVPLVAGVIIGAPFVAGALFPVVTAWIRHPELHRLSLTDARTLVGAAERIPRDMALERGFLGELRTFLDLGLRDQYENAAANADLRRFIIELAEWMGTDHVEAAPPLRVVNAGEVVP